MAELNIDASLVKSSLVVQRESEVAMVQMQNGKRVLKSQTSAYYLMTKVL